MVLKGLERFLHVCLSARQGSSIELTNPEDRVYPHLQRYLQLVCGEVNPSVHLTRLEERLAIQTRVWTQTSDIASNGAALKDTPLLCLKDRDFANWRLGLETGGFNVLVEVKSRQLNINAVVLGCNEYLEHAVVGWVRVELLLDMNSINNKTSTQDVSASETLKW